MKASWVLAAGLLCIVGCQRQEASRNAPAKASPGQTVRNRMVYRHSVIPGGVESAEELKAKLDADAEAREHYRGLDPRKFRPVRLERDVRLHVSYRTKRGIFWTAQKVLIPKGELVLTDGQESVRARCGNRLSDEAAGEAQEDEPAAEELNAEEDGPSWSSASGPAGVPQFGYGAPGSAPNPHLPRMLADLGQPQPNDPVPGPPIDGGPSVRNELGAQLGGGSFAGGLPPLPALPGIPPPPAGTGSNGPPPPGPPGGIAQNPPGYSFPREEPGSDPPPPGNSPPTPLYPRDPAPPPGSPDPRNPPGPMPTPGSPGPKPPLPGPPSTVPPPGPPGTPKPGPPPPEVVDPLPKIPPGFRPVPPTGGDTPPPGSHVPEPAAVLLVALGLAVVAIRTSRRKLRGF